MERKLVGGHIGGGGRNERCRGHKTSAKGQHGNGCIGSEGMKRLSAGDRVSGGWLRQEGSNASGRSPFTSGRNEPGWMHPEQELTL